MLDNFKQDAVTEGKKISTYSKPTNSFAKLSPEKYQQLLEFLEQDLRYGINKSRERDTTKDS
jgi:hypothetical protein